MNQNGNVARGIILEVPFKEKDLAKALGAWWDPEIKKWFVPKGRDSTPFARWIAVDGLPASSRSPLEDDPEAES